MSMVYVVGYGLKEQKEDPPEEFTTEQLDAFTMQYGWIIDRIVSIRSSIQSDTLSITKGQLRAMNGMMEFTWKMRMYRLAILSTMIGKEVESSSHMKRRESSAVISFMKSDDSWRLTDEARRFLTHTQSFIERYPSFQAREHIIRAVVAHMSDMQ
jgi:hypothetical protein